VGTISDDVVDRRQVKANARREVGVQGRAYDMPVDPGTHRAASSGGSGGSHGGKGEHQQRANNTDHASTPALHSCTTACTGHGAGCPRCEDDSVGLAYMSWCEPQAPARSAGMIVKAQLARPFVYPMSSLDAHFI